ncbi:hypothetical protein FRAHR75_100066 [Frankia sp. Hr75.2]|nr:hypothetical protein FRAHR75_100066 [Frankia sp. Hr75.2]SQE00672.1 hypothetical protein FMEAI12_6990003 [Parafrankia sp. Ea1.12]
MLAGEHVAGAGEARLHLVGDEHDPGLRAELGQSGQEAGAGDDEAALALDRFDDERGDVLRADLRGDRLHHLGRGLFAACGGAARPAVGVGHRHPVDLRGERPEVVLVGHRLRGQCHRQVRPAVVGVRERHDGGPSGVGPGDFHRVLDRLGARVEQGGPFLVPARGEPGELLAHGDVALVGSHHETGVGEEPGLLAHVLHDSVGGVADAHHRDAGTEVDQRVPVDVHQHATAGRRDVDGQGFADPAGHRLGPAFRQLHRARPGYRGDQPADLRQSGPAPRGQLSLAGLTHDLSRPDPSLSAVRLSAGPDNTRPAGGTQTGAPGDARRRPSDRFAPGRRGHRTDTERLVVSAWGYGASSVRSRMSGGVPVVDTCCSVG